MASVSSIEYWDGNKVRRLRLQGVYDGRQRSARRSPQAGAARTAAFESMRPQASGAAIVGSLQQQAPRLKTRFREIHEDQTLVAPVEPGETTVIPTETITVNNPRVADINWLRNKYGLIEVDRGRHGKVLMRVPDDAVNAIPLAAEAALALHQRQGRASAHPNFLRIMQRTPAPAAPPGAPQWGLDNEGNPGLVGADVHGLAAWSATRGDDSARVAVLDEGVDTNHPFLAPAVVDEADFVDGNASARPDGDDAHGTACAGIIASRNQNVSGLAPEVSLVAARIAKSDSQGFWIFDDFATADAIDWCWDDASADVLSNSWGGGPPAPVITLAFERAGVSGRNGRGAVVVVAAGNSQSLIGYPGNLPFVVTVGASNQWDKRKTRTSQDGEGWWGSDYGQGLDLMAPGVVIATTDISGPRGYSNTQTTAGFNGTSSATPFVAAAAALMISENPNLSGQRVRELLRESADPLTKSGKWSRFTGYGRLNAYNAIRAARRG